MARPAWIKREVSDDIFHNEILGSTYRIINTLNTFSVFAFIATVSLAIAFPDIYRSWK